MRLATVFAVLVCFSIGQAEAAVVGKRPAQCPHRYCGCALSIKIFGKPIRDLFLALNWRRFPRAAPAPGMVAVRRGHVFQLLAHVRGDTWTVFNPNSGGGLTRIHHRRIAGYSIHNPRAYRTAHVF